MNKYLDDDETDSDLDDDIDIHEVVRVGTFDEVKEAIALDRPRLIALKDELKRTALHYAAEMNKIKVAVFLIAKQANINAADDKDQTPLHLASAKGFTEMVRTLLEFDADIKLRDKNCRTALHLAVEGNYLETATLLVKRGVDLNAEEYRYGRTALHIAAEKGYTEMVTMLLIRGADMYASGDQFYSRTPLHLACIHGHTEVVRVLVKRGADVSVLSGFLDMNPLHLACEHGHWEAAEILMNQGMDLDVCGNHINGSTALHICAQLNQLAILQILVEKGANMNKLGRFSTAGTPLHVACTYGNAHAANLLVSLGADKNARDESAHTPLHYACKESQFDCVFMLIDLEADVTARADNNKLAFDYITVPTIKEKVLIATAAVNRRIEARLEAERAAAEAEAERQRKEQERLERLRREEEERIRLAVLRKAAFTKALRSVADISGEASALLGVAEAYPDQDVNVNIIQPATEYKSETFQYQEDIDYDMDSLTGTVHSHTTVGTTYEVYRLVNSLWNSSALTRAALRGFAEIVHALLQWPGVQINYQESNGNTALHNAALIGNREIVEMLLLAGANLTVLNYEGKVAANVAKTNYLRELIRNPALMTTRMQYQDRVLDHLFLQLKCKEGMSLTLQEAVTANQMIEFQPPVEAKQRVVVEPAASASKATKPHLIPALELEGGEADGSPPKHKSKYYKPPKRKASDAVANNGMNHHGVGALKSILKHVNESGTLTAAPLVVFTPSSVPPELAYLFPNNELSVPAHVQQQLLLEDGMLGTASQSLLPNAPSNSNGMKAAISPIRAPAPSSSGGAADPVISNILRKYGPVPGNFGGSVSDFFFLRSANDPRRKSPTRNSDQHASGRDFSGNDTRFLDLLTLQRSYVPSAFDSTDEWNDIKDFLWLLGQPFKPVKDSGALWLTNGPQDAYQSDEVSSGQGQRNNGDSSVRSELTDPHYPSSVDVSTDRRFVLYRIAVTMNSIQAAFTDTDSLEVKTNSPKPLAGSMHEQTTALSTSHHNNNISHNSLPKILGVHSNAERDEVKFLCSPVAQIKRMLSLEEQSLREEASVAESKLQVLEKGLDWARIPTNLSRADVHRLVRFARHCEEYVLLVLQLYAPREYGWPNEMHDEAGALLTEHVRYNVQYLQYYGLASAQVEEHLLNLVDLSYTAVFVDVSRERTASRSDDSGGNKHKVGFVEPSSTLGGENNRHHQQHHQQQKHNKSNHAATTRGRKVPDLLHNPPRYLRLAVDCVYEVSDFIKARAEQGYPTDSVRAHLLAQAGRALIAQQRSVAAQQLQGGVVPAGFSSRAGSGGAELMSNKDSNGGGTMRGQGEGSFGNSSSNAFTAPLSQAAVGWTAMMVPSPSQVGYRRWLAELLLLDYEAYFQHQGFRRLSDFVGLTEQDCTEYFPFLKAGDLRRLTRAAPYLTDESIVTYETD